MDSAHDGKLQPEGPILPGVEGDTGDGDGESEEEGAIPGADDSVVFRDREENGGDIAPNNNRGTTRFNPTTKRLHFNTTPIPPAREREVHTQGEAPQIRNSQPNIRAPARMSTRQYLAIPVTQANTRVATPLRGTPQSIPRQAGNIIQKRTPPSLKDTQHSVRNSPTRTPMGEDLLGEDPPREDPKGEAPQADDEEYQEAHSNRHQDEDWFDASWKRYVHTTEPSPTYKEEGGQTQAKFYSGWQTWRASLKTRE
ncbi:hypothetical protein Pelo_18289 [Pelomyxa schiedti]|nr:hypothetical protein Pelo_18289 [Pelomyxa schiedti]